MQRRERLTQSIEVLFYDRRRYYVAFFFGMRKVLVSGVLHSHSSDASNRYIYPGLPGRYSGETERSIVRLSKDHLGWKISWHFKADAPEALIQSFVFAHQTALKIFTLEVNFCTKWPKAVELYFLNVYSVKCSLLPMIHMIRPNFYETCFENLTDIMKVAVLIFDQNDITGKAKTEYEGAISAFKRFYEGRESEELKKAASLEVETPSSPDERSSPRKSRAAEPTMEPPEFDLSNSHLPTAEEAPVVLGSLKEKEKNDHKSNPTDPAKNPSRLSISTELDMDASFSGSTSTARETLTKGFTYPDPSQQSLVPTPTLSPFSVSSILEPKPVQLSPKAPKKKNPPLCCVLL